ncbi:helix-turn-helix transcriptional regulator [Aliiruegeria lutimaris]|uniref:DNA-binding transcriptional regulator, XRE-family HTH domain n=1 Tax=Aliiruegeria lutimaris TaxID=571298 RepID=A0A1G9IN82_9RHOB|nr:helix-turn-helix transcriptional regulator [Aliiruegeria lutimaris]SDL26476.1 DNA-binding transcriptional regulator, XRE-family HTH domain [Aliiruegeria lutimaris]
MTTEFALDLRAARRKAGYVQGDVAHLLGMHQSTVSELETGRKLPTLTQTVTLSLIYGRSFESLFAAVMKEARRDLKKRLRGLPKNVRDHPGTLNRKASIDRLRQRLKEEAKDYGDV